MNANARPARPDYAEPGERSTPLAQSRGLAPRQPLEAGFTMVEIAICIAVLAFALVAIIGVLPTGLQVQKQNREETVIQQEGQFWLEAIRGGALGLDNLTNYVDVISVTNSAGKVRGISYTYGLGFRNGRDIIGLLSLPKWHQYKAANGTTVLLSNVTVIAYVRALTGSAAEKTPTNDFAFRYRLIPELSPLNPVAGMNTNWNEFNLARDNPVEWAARSNLFLTAVTLRENAYELRVSLDWPVYLTANGPRVGNNHKVFRTLVSGSLWGTNVDYLDRRDLFFLQPSEYVLVR